MTLQAKDRLGPNEVLDLIGAGGMGEVHRARDPRLEREVAVKVFLSEIAADSAAVRDPEAPDGWRIELVPIPGWEELPTW
jgi:serine/threonine protein kinase